MSRLTSFIKSLATITGFAAVAALFFVGCGEDGGSSSAPSNVDQIVATYEDLTLCTVNREGASAYVKDEKTEYICSGGNWIPASDMVVAVKNKTISGSAQKGPFVNGASVTVQELDGETLAQTGKSFKGKITGDKGEFSVSSVTLASQYALLEATGYYMNENTGAKSNGTITLNALVDLSKRENVNINLLTHLEYERALYLTTTGMNVPAAKKQAEKEIFEAFGITGEFANSEELNILSTSEGDAALLAISVLMQGNLTEAELSERLANFASDIEKDGKWDNDTVKAQIADWASTTNFANIGVNVKAMSANGNAPAFEPIVKNFWWNEYGLGGCSANNDNEVKKNADLHSTFSSSYYLCDSNLSNWRVATILEYDLYQWSVGNDGELKRGNVSAGFYKYDSLQGRWVEATNRDISLELNGCTQNRESEIGQGGDDQYYICRSGQWQNATFLDRDTEGRTCLHDAEFVAGVLVDSNRYVCDAGVFRVVTNSEKIVGAGCTSYNLKEERLFAGYMQCAESGEWRVSAHTVSGTMIDTRDGKVYKTIGIGMHTWLDENLNYEYKINGVTYGNWCYMNSTDSCAKYGRLYTWGAMIDSAKTGYGYGKPGGYNPIQGVCPAGWHLAYEWSSLLGWDWDIPSAFSVCNSGKFSGTFLEPNQPTNPSRPGQPYGCWVSIDSDNCEESSFFDCNEDVDLTRGYPIRCVKD